MAERPEDLNLPNSVVARIIKEALPSNVNVSRDARLAMSKAASVFVLYATSCANAFATAGKRKTITGQDVLMAMEEMEFEKFVEPLKNALEAYKEEQKSRKSAAASKKVSGDNTNVTKGAEEKAADDAMVIEGEDEDEQVTEKDTQNVDNEET